MLLVRAIKGPSLDQIGIIVSFVSSILCRSRAEITMTSSSVLATRIPVRAVPSQKGHFGIPQGFCRVQPLRLRKNPPFVLYAEPDVEGAIKEAEEACESGSDAECATAWDTVEELSAAKSDKEKQGQRKDPLEEYCEEAPDADECRVYED